MEIDWTLLLTVVIGTLAVIGLILALQSKAGRGRLADGALRLAEALIAYAIGWLDGRGTGNVDVPAGVTMDDRVVRAKTALAILRG